jgi:hypothetical protein
LRDHPHSAKTWADLAANHPEFFRVYQGKGEPSISLIARYMIGKPGEDEGPALGIDYVRGLIDAATKIHQGQLQRRQVLRIAWAAVIVAVIPALIQAVVAVSLKW